MNGYELVRLQPNQVKKNGDTMSGNLTMINNARFVGPLSGNATTATKLQTARYINGTLFDGTAQITTANWGTGRNITIGNTTKLVNGSTPVVWTLAEIGAVNRAGDTIAGALNVGGNVTTTSGGSYIVASNASRVGAYEVHRLNYGWAKLSVFGSGTGALAIEGYNNNSQIVSYMVIGSRGVYPRQVAGFTPELGDIDARFLDVWCTRGAFNGSDSKLKENIEKLSREVSRNKRDKSVNSIDFYDYVKNSSAYTFNYRSTKENFIGIIANNIPDNVFEKIGVLSKTEEKYNEELENKKKYKEILSNIDLSSEEIDKDEVEQTTGLTYKELEYQSNRPIEAPVRLINAPAQVAMLQEVLSIALNKIETLENKIQELTNN